MKVSLSVPMVTTLDSSTDRSDVADLLSQLLGEPLPTRQIPDLWVFLAALSTVLVGVTYADSQVTDAEKQRLKKILAQFMTAGNDLNQIIKLLIKGVQQSKLYNKPDDLVRLTERLSAPERLLLVAFGYEIATADGTIDSKERQYLHTVADRLQIGSQLLVVLEESFTGQPISNESAAEEIRYLLDPSRFQVLDPVFTHAAGQMLGNLPQSSHVHDASPSARLKYEALAQDQAQRRQLEKHCNDLTKLLSDAQDHEAFPQALTDVATLAQKVRSQTFRVAVVGEFSQGKSTLLNALLGEEIQPVRAIPCSGTITVLRHGEQKRVICRYRNGSEKEIPAEDYREKAMISVEAALNNRDDALISSEIEEIIFEHPGLALCRSGVEILDSPGLNEHPERSRITHKLLQDVDAVIFLINATRPLTQSERELLQSLKTQLSGATDQPAKNLFVLVNFMDLLRKEQDRQQVKQLVENFVCGDSALIASKNRLHFISAQAALDAMLTGDKNEYLETLQQFVCSLEQFLTIEKGAIENQKSAKALDTIAQQVIGSLTQTQQTIEGKITLSEASKQSILEKLGEASGYLGNLQRQIQLLSDKKLSEVLDLSSSFVKEDLLKRMSEEAKNWKSQQTKKSEIIKEFSEKLQAESQSMIEEWTQEIILQKTLSTTLKSLDLNICKVIHHFQKSAKFIDQGTGSQLVSQLNSRIEQVAPQFKFNPSTEAGVDAWETFWKSGIGGGVGLGAGGVVAGGVAFAVTSIAFFPVVLTGAAIAGIAVAGAALGTAIGGAFGFFTPPNQDEIRKEVLDTGLQQFTAQNLESQLATSIESLVQGLFNQRLQTIEGVTKLYMTLLNSLLVASETAHALTLEETETKKCSNAKYLSKLEAFRSELNKSFL
jgi:uncharacterized tellurite resistance protein B-like protein/predicted GTPase